MSKWVYFTWVYFTHAKFPSIYSTVLADAETTSKETSMSKQKLTILSINVRSGVSQKTQRPYTIREAQCILEQSVDGASNIVVGVINLPETLADRPAGEYLAEFSLAQGNGQDAGRLVPRIVSLVPYGNVRAQPKPDAKAA